MRPPQYTITRRTVHVYAEYVCQRHIRLKDHGPKCKASVLWAVLFWAATRISSLAAACAALRAAPSDTAAHDALLATLPTITELQRRLNRALQGDLPKALRRRAQPLAIDLKLVPYHGQPLRDADEVYRSQARDGTSHFHAYATAYVSRHGQRFTVALTRVTKGQPLQEVVQELLRQAARAGVRPQGRPPPRAQRQSRVRLVEAQRLGPLYHDQRHQGAGHGQRLCQVPQPQRRAGQARAGGAGVRLRRRAGAGLVPVGAGDVPAAVRDRGQLPAVGAGAHPDEHARPAAAAVVCGGGPDPAQRVGLAALGGTFSAPPRRPADRLGPIDLPRHAAVAAALRRGVAGPA